MIIYVLSQILSEDTVIAIVQNEKDFDTSLFNRYADPVHFLSPKVLALLNQEEVKKYINTFYNEYIADYIEKFEVPELDFNSIYINEECIKEACVLDVNNFMEEVHFTDLDDQLLWDDADCLFICQLNDWQDEDGFEPIFN